jgi:hypothetical protein
VSRIVFSWVEAVAFAGEDAARAVDEQDVDRVGAGTSEFAHSLPDVGVDGDRAGARGVGPDAARHAAVDEPPGRRIRG